MKRGEVIAKLGNSGNSMEPHLHFQMMDKAVFLQSNAIVYGFDRFKVIPSKLNNVEGELKAFSNQLPLENTLMSFE